MIDYKYICTFVGICTLKFNFFFEGTRVVRRTRGGNANILES